MTTTQNQSSPFVIYSKPFGFQNLDRKSTNLVSWTAVEHYKSRIKTFETYAEKLYVASTSTALSPAPLAVPEFVGPLGLLDQGGRRGRGLQATGHIRAGDLLIVSKALAIVQGVTKSSNELQRFKLLRDSVANLIGNGGPTAASTTYELWAGENLGYLDPSMETQVDGPLVDRERIERICTLNAFETAQGPPNTRAYGLWWLPSFLNHDCYGANAHWTVCQNFMFIRAAKDIPQGEEILISYIDPTGESQKQTRFFHQHEFICECTLCKAERLEGPSVRKQRDRLLEDFAFLKARGCLKDPVELDHEFIAPLESLRSEHSELNIFLIQPLVELGLLYYEKQRFKDALQPLQRAYALTENLAQFGGLKISIGMTIVTCLSKCETGDMETITKCLEKVKSAAIVQFGKVEILKLVRPSFYTEFLACSN